MLQQLVTPTCTNFGFEALDQLRHSVTFVRDSFSQVTTTETRSTYLELLNTFFLKVWTQEPPRISAYTLYF